MGIYAYHGERGVTIEVSSRLLQSLNGGDRCIRDVVVWESGCHEDSGGDDYVSATGENLYIKTPLRFVDCRANVNFDFPFRENLVLTL